MDLVGDNGSASNSEPAKEHHSTGETEAEHSSTSCGTSGDSGPVQGDLSTGDAKGGHALINDAGTAKHATFSSIIAHFKSNNSTLHCFGASGV